jgi:hypothetical protein
VALRYETWDKRANLLAWKAQLVRVEREQQVSFSDEARKHLFEFMRDESRKGHAWSGREMENYYGVAIAMMRADSEGEEEQKIVEVEHLRVAASAVWTCD